MLFRSMVAFFVMVVTASTAYAGAWLQPKGQGLAIAQATYYGTSAYFDDRGSMNSQPRFSKLELQPYVEYGLFNALTVGGSAYVQRVEQSHTDNYGIADPEIFARARLWHNENQVLSIQPLVKSSSYFTKGRPPNGGSRSTDAELSLLYGRGLPIFTARDYLDVRVGYRVRNHGLSDQVRLDITNGIKLNEKWEITPALRAVIATDVQDVITYRESGDQDYSVLKAEVSGIYHLNEKQWLQAGLFKHVAGVQTGAGYGASIGFAQRF